MCIAQRNRLFLVVCLWNVTANNMMLHCIALRNKLCSFASQWQWLMNNVSEYSRNVCGVYATIEMIYIHKRRNIVLHNYVHCIICCLSTFALLNAATHLHTEIEQKKKKTQTKSSICNTSLLCIHMQTDVHYVFYLVFSF